MLQNGTTGGPLIVYQRRDLSEYGELRGKRCVKQWRECFGGLHVPCEFGSAASTCYSVELVLLTEVTDRWKSR